MRIAILTQPLGGNYGGILQNYALQQVLIGLGHTPVTLDRQRERHHTMFKDMARRIMRLKNPSYGEAMLTSPEHKLIDSRLSDFISKHINKTIPLRTQSAFDTYVEQNHFDAYIVGSDQCWRPCYSPNIDNYYLDFINDHAIKRIVYGASFGVDKWEYTETQTIKAREAARQLNSVSVRESSGIELCHSHLSIDAKLVVDPTILLGIEGFHKFISKSVERSSFITTYLLEQTTETAELVNKIRKLLGIENIVENNIDSTFRRFENINNHKKISVEEWISNIANSEFVITDSFHGAVFSILFNRPFIIHLNGVRGNARIHSLLALTGLEECICRNPDNITIPVYDWNKVNNQINVLRKGSEDFLIKALR